MCKSFLLPIELKKQNPSGIFPDFQQQFLESMTPCSIVSVEEQDLEQAVTETSTPVKAKTALG